VAVFLAGLPLIELGFDPPARPITGRIPIPVAGGTSTMTYDPAVGWVDGDEKQDLAMVRQGAASFTVERTADCGAALTAAIERVRADEPAVPNATGDRHRAAGLDGALRTWSGPTSEGLVFTACRGTEGLLAVARGPIGSLAADGYADVLAMVDSLEVR
jgi:hypothetical protein